MTIVLQQSTRQLWAKSDPVSGEWHPLWCHLIDVGMVAEARWRRLTPALREGVAAWLHLPVEDAERTVAWLAAAHDLGKASPDFQMKVPARWAALQAKGFVGRQKVGAPHGQVSGRRILQTLRARKPGPNGMLVGLAIASAIHHGHYDDLPGAVALDALDIIEPDWNRLSDELASLLSSVWPLPSLAATPRYIGSRYFLWLSAFISVSDWIGSNAEVFGYGNADEDVVAYVEGSRTRAAAAVASLGIEVAPMPRPADFASRFGFSPRALQVETRRLVTAAQGPTLLLVECPMGEGKTEAALDAAAELLARGAAGLFVGLPTQATANAMLGRVERFMDRAVGAGWSVRLAHGNAAMVERAPQPIGTWDDDNDGGRSDRAAEWFSGSKRALLEPVGVGTIDQTLLGVLFARHGFVRIGALAGKVVVLDEVHAYDTYTGYFVKLLCAWLGAQGSSVILLSATLPSAKRTELLTAWSEATGQSAVVDTPAYPRVTSVSAGGAVAVHVPGSPERRRNITLTWLDDESEVVASWLLDRLSEGGCGAWICNTVRRSRAAFDALSAEAARRGLELELDLLHARFTIADRQAKEQSALSKYGPGGAAPRPMRAVLVGTQVLEQSLDVDFDVMVTDLAPVDLILQRAGRLHRHIGRARTQTTAMPMLAVVGGAVPDDYDPGVSAYVYGEWVLLRSRVVLHGRAQVQLPDEIEGIVEAVYSGAAVSASESLAARIAAAQPNKAAGDGANHAKAERHALDAPSPKGGLPWSTVRQSALFDHEDDDPTATRLGEESVRIVLVERSGGVCRTLGAECRQVDLGNAPTPADIRALLASSLTVAVSHLRGALPALRAATPAPWRSAPSLGRAVVLVLDGGVATIESKTFVYSWERGFAARAPVEGGSP